MHPESFVLDATELLLYWNLPEDALPDTVWRHASVMAGTTPEEPADAGQD